MPQKPPLVSETFPDLDLESIRIAYSEPKDCITLTYLETVVECRDTLSSGWKTCPDNTGHQVRKLVYMMPVPPDMPPAMAKMLGVPKILQGTTVQRLCGGADEVTLVQHSYTRDMMYSDRFIVQCITNFRCDSKGGVVMRQWFDPIWTGSLPWTHSAVKHFVEKRVKVEALHRSAEFARIVQDVAGRHRDPHQQHS